MMQTTFDFGDGIHITDATIRRISDEFFEILKKELPEESQCSRVVDFVIKELGSNLEFRRLIL